MELINFEDVCNLSHVLFTELDRCFENLFSTLFKHNAETCPTFATTEESIGLAILFLRCCLKIMTLLMPNQEVVLEKGKTLLSILSRLIRSTNGDCSFVISHDEPLDPRYTFLWEGLEVNFDKFVDNCSS